LLVFSHFQPEDGNIIDGYIPAAKASAGYDYTESETMPQFKGHKNTVETDQESSLVQAVYKYVRVTGDRSILRETVNGKTVLARLQLALDYVLSRRFNADYGLVWGATTVDWGDVQPEHEWGVAFDKSSHRAIDVYDNAMFVIAADNLAELLRESGADSSRWSAVRDHVRSNARRYLWDARRHKFRPHIYLDGSPFPGDFEEDRIYYHGGTAIAIEAGFLNRDEIDLVLNDLRNNVRFAGAASIGLTVFPAYPSGYFKNPAMKPYSYQNGGDWSWFGGRMIQQLIEHGFVEEAYTELIPMLQRVRRNNGFFEWYTVDDQPRGSGTFRGSAGVLAKAVLMLKSWAEDSLRQATGRP
jgi:glycogen debranching enzyme